LETTSYCCHCRPNSWDASTHARGLSRDVPLWWCTGTFLLLNVFRVGWAMLFMEEISKKFSG
jgi:hypothetical protein